MEDVYANLHIPSIYIPLIIRLHKNQILKFSHSGSLLFLFPIYFIYIVLYKVM